MDNTQLFVPETILAGYNERSNTYTGKLAYLIYRDEKGKLRKEKSWKSWIEEKLGTDEFENIPTEGFVINKNVGGYKYDWFYRSEKLRVYDPRGFEIEITLDNLLFILEYANSIKGKGLEGKFIYGWAGTELILIPCDSPQYKEIKEYNDLIRSDFKATLKTMLIGGQYKTDKESDVVYLGRYNYYENEKRLKESAEVEQQVGYLSIDKGKKYWFYDLGSEQTLFLPLNKLKRQLSSVPYPETEQLITDLLKENRLNKIVEKERIYIKDKETLINLLKQQTSFINKSQYDTESEIILLNNDGKIAYELELEKYSDRSYYYAGNHTIKDKLGKEILHDELYSKEYKEKGFLVFNLFLKEIEIGYQKISNYGYGRDRYSSYRYANTVDTKRFELKFTEFKSFSDSDKYYKYIENIRLYDKEIEEKINSYWEQLEPLLKDTYYAVYGREEDDLLNHNLINETYIQTNKVHDTK